MEQALVRHEKQVLSQDYDRKKLRQEMKTTIETQAFENQLNTLTKARKSKQIDQELNLQVKTRLEQDEADLKDRQAMVKPHFGPEDPEPAIFTTKKAQEISGVKTDLLQQIQDRKEIKNLKLEIKKI